MIVRRESQPAMFAVDGPAKVMITVENGKVVAAFEIGDDVKFAMESGAKLKQCGVTPDDSPQDLIRKVRNEPSRAS